MQDRSDRRHSRLCFVVLLALCAAPVGAADLPGTATLRSWVEGFKESPRGPFERIRWFCKDGSVQAPRPYACKDHGGGVQHGEWNEQAQALRDGGYSIANVLAQLDPEEFTGPDADLGALEQILIERFLIGWDDGWIFRGARSYRGALQIEDEEAGARAVVLAMLADPRWRNPSRYYLLRETVRLFPLQEDEGSAADVRAQALRLAEKDPPFTPLRAKIHNVPDAVDAKRVREFAAAKGKSGLADEYEALAAAIDALYTSSSAAETALALAPQVADPKLSKALLDFGGWLADEPDPAKRLSASSRLSGLIRKHFAKVPDPETALALIQLSLVLERETYTNGNTVLTQADGLSRRERLDLVDRSAEALYGAGLISMRHLVGIKQTVARIEQAGTPSVNEYREELRYLARAPEWSGRWIAFNFEQAATQLAPLEPEVHLYAQDRLRGSPLLFYGAMTDGLVRDANTLGAIEHELFGTRVGAGLRALNPGLTRGVLRSAEDGRFQPNGVYLLPETTSDLPRVSGILTRGEGSSLSHVQLLARNLGIPNVVVGEEHLSEVERRMGSDVVLAVSQGGVVRLVSDGPQWASVFGAEAKVPDMVIRPDLEKLDLLPTDLIPLSQLRATDSGRTSGPKGANLGELKHYFGSAVPNGFVIPFGVFRALLDQPIEPGGPSTFDWMKQSYATFETESDPARKQAMISEFLTKLRKWIETTDPGPEFRTKLESMLESSFGPDGTYGVFVRSDTNVEDLPGFTGAGLNLTVPNVVGYPNILREIHEVWASPFTERAFGWRQSHMEDPEFVFPAVVIQLGFPAEKSGVMVTADIERGLEDWITVAVSEGVGGAVEGQATESLLVNTRTADVRYLAQATAPEKAVLSHSGGIDHVSASGTDSVLSPQEIDQLVDFAKGASDRFPTLRDEAGNPMPADVEFAFKDGKLALLQMRPFVESRRARSNAYLGRLDAGLVERGKRRVDLAGVPGQEPKSAVSTDEILVD
jgi:hypothetical protein